MYYCLHWLRRSTRVGIGLDVRKRVRGEYLNAHPYYHKHCNANAHTHNYTDTYNYADTHIYEDAYSHGYTDKHAKYE